MSMRMTMTTRGGAVAPERQRGRRM
jgi:hypothetical protein